eukprot:CAMPEP_0181389158 /NCGR_PEP_ID=MMETSP1106-20121128/24742_1 /TAXON_ID=81844 /ORGANISM="Mantoniella antarctica, Strain SL-175" /LENGTH=104 /DNA_ID=CAMNT_0023509863 /DNA_START=576 /DNA_END=891 /DNA_ORIENTATION=-
MAKAVIGGAGKCGTGLACALDQQPVRRLLAVKTVPVLPRPRSSRGADVFGVTIDDRRRARPGPSRVTPAPPRLPRASSRDVLLNAAEGALRVSDLKLDATTWTL